MKILGIDPGSRLTGFGIIDCSGSQPRLLHHGVVKVGSGDFPTRLGVIFTAISELIRDYGPQQAAVETQFVSRNVMSALKLGQARGAAVCAAVAGGLSVAEYAPRQVKLAVVGTGKADKHQVQHMIATLLNTRESLGEDAADALAVALCHHHHYQTGQRLQRSGREAIGGGRS